MNVTTARDTLNEELRVHVLHVGTNVTATMTIVKSAHRIHVYQLTLVSLRLWVDNNN